MEIVANKPVSCVLQVLAEHEIAPHMVNLLSEVSSKTTTSTLLSDLPSIVETEKR